MLAAVIDRNRAAAVVVLLLGLVLAQLMPLGLVLSGAVACFVTLRKGAASGITVAGGGIAGLAIMTAAAGYPPGSGLAVPVGFLGASLAVAWTLDYSRSLALAVWLSLALTLTALLAFWLVLDDPAAYWKGLFDQVVQAAREAGRVDLAEQFEQMSDQLRWPAVTGQFFGCLFLLLILALSWGRSWQARLVNPGGFAKEFSELTLGRSLALASAAAFMGAAASGLDLALSVAAVLLYVWLVPALALIHWLVAKAGLGSGWLWAAYVLCALTWLGNNTLFLLFPLAGMLNEFINFRRRPGSGNGDD